MADRHAYYLTVLQGYGPTLDMQTARDRVIGILLGNVIVLVVFSTIWPVRVAQPVRRQVALAIAKIAELTRLRHDLPPENPGSQPALQAGFISAIGGARALLANAAYEPANTEHAGRSLDRGVLADLEVVMLMVTVIYRLNTEAAPTSNQAALSYGGALAAWLDDCAAWVRSGTGGPVIEAALPDPPRLGEDAGTRMRATWYRLLDVKLRSIMGRVMRGAELRVGDAARHG